MDETQAIIENIQKALKLIDMQTMMPSTPETGAMSHEQLGEFKQILMNMAANLRLPKLVKERVTGDDYQARMSQMIAKNWPMNDLGRQIMKAEDSYVKLREKLRA
ncbi:MAG: hypothetical protein K8S20_16710 [Chloroflexi bacterium]|nr:hypothetical protein [Chloroflexota bacterium]